MLEKIFEIKTMLDERFIDVLNLLGSNYEIQIDVFPSFVVIPDELALMFDDEFRRVRNQNTITEDQFLLLNKIDSIFEKMGGIEKYWTLEYLSEGSEWAEVRLIAIKLLLSFGETPKRPKMNWMKYTEG